MGVTCRLKMKTFILFIASAFFICSCWAEDENLPVVQGSRKPKVYLISTTTSTSTLSTTSICFIMFTTTNGLYTCSKKKRSLPLIGDEPIDEAKDIISPNRALVADEPHAIEDVVANNEVISSQDELDQEREAKFINYWMTTTITTTYTSYTATSSVGSVVCTPLGYTNQNCPNNG